MKSIFTRLMAAMLSLVLFLPQITLAQGIDPAARGLAVQAQTVSGQMSQWRPVNYSIQLNKYFTTSGALTTFNTFQCFLYRLTGRETALRASGLISGAGMQFVSYFDGNMNFIGYQFRGTNGSNTPFVQQVLTLPAGTVYIGINSLAAGAPVLEAQFSTSNLARRNADNDEANDTGGMYWMVMSGTYTNNARYNNSGNLNTGVTGFNTTLYAIPNPYYTYRADGATSGTGSALAVYFKADMTFLGLQQVGVNGVTATQSVILSPPPGTAFIAVNNANSQVLPVLAQRAPSLAAQRLGAIEPVSRPWAGKSMVWFGTSIPAGSVAGGKYPDKVAALIGANITNEAQGSSMIRAGKKSLANGSVVVGSITGSVLTVTKVLYGTVATGQAVSAAIIPGGATTVSSFGTGSGGVGTYNLSTSVGTPVASTTIFLGPDPLGWTGLNYLNVAYALAMYVGEKNELINNWTKWQTLLTGSPPATLDAPTQALWIDCSFENRLVARHLGANRKAVYILDHGHNDWAITGDGGDMLTVPASGTPDDRLLFLGAERFIINLILADNQRARIWFIGHYEADRKVDIVKAQTLLQQTWQFPLFPTWAQMGYSQNLLTVGSTTQTMTQWRMPDDLHPHSDTTGSETSLYAAVLAPWISAQR